MQVVRDTTACAATKVRANLAAPGVTRQTASRRFDSYRGWLVIRPEGAVSAADGTIAACHRAGCARYMDANSTTMASRCEHQSADSYGAERPGLATAVRGHIRGTLPFTVAPTECARQATESLGYVRRVNVDDAPVARTTIHNNCSAPEGVIRTLEFERQDCGFSKSLNPDIVRHNIGPGLCAPGGRRAENDTEAALNL